MLPAECTTMLVTRRRPCTRRCLMRSSACRCGLPTRRLKSAETWRSRRGCLNGTRKGCHGVSCLRRSARYSDPKWRSSGRCGPPHPGRATSFACPSSYWIPRSSSFRASWCTGAPLTPTTTRRASPAATLASVGATTRGTMTTACPVTHGWRCFASLESSTSGATGMSAPLGRCGSGLQWGAEYGSTRDGHSCTAALHHRMSTRAAGKRARTGTIRYSSRGPSAAFRSS
mmetsp:Transcript_5765/g.19127  ORF Transcript_5765/g.19127 Transcript_5765/m.19127 type:complete len:229 (+) Transcript_5765:367-1053(+)